MRRHPSLASVRGFTLVEVLVVTAILATMLGLSAHAMARAGQGAALGSSARLVRSALMRAKQLARQDQTLSSVTADPGAPADNRPGVLYLRTARRAATLSFESFESGKTPMGDALMATVLGAVPAAKGTIRQGATVAGGGRIQSPSLTNAPTLNPGKGFSLELDLNPGGPGQIAAFGANGDEFSFTFSLDADGALLAEIMVAPEGTIRKLKSPPGIVAPDAWNRVGVAWDGVALSLTSHGVVEATLEEARPLMVPKDGALMIGGGVSGTLDTVTYVTVTEADPFTLARNVSFDLKAPLTVRFDSDGRLDRRVHTEPVKFVLVQEDRREEITVDLAGVIR